MNLCAVVYIVVSRRIPHVGLTGAGKGGGGVIDERYVTFGGVPSSVTKRYKALQSITKRYKVSQSVTKRHKATKCHKASQSVTKRHKASQSVTKRHKASQSVTREWGVGGCQVFSVNPTAYDDDEHSLVGLHDVVVTAFQARLSNLRHRPIGIGVQGLADAFILMRFPFESAEAQQLNRDIFETIYYAAVKMSVKMAREDGPYETYAGSPASQGVSQHAPTLTPTRRTRAPRQPGGESTRSDPEPDPYETYPGPPPAGRCVNTP